MKYLFEDTRNKIGKHKNIEEYCRNNGIEIVRQSLCVGDYTLPADHSVCIDTKKDLLELAMDLGNDKSRFYKEVRRAVQYGIKLIVLTEHGGKVKSIQDVAAWNNPLLNPRHPKHCANAMTGRELMERIYRCHIAYGAEFLFCDKRETGRRILELLGGDTIERGA